MDERDRIAAASDPRALFGDAVSDPRALRKAYAKLAKRWRADAELSAHIRALFEQARDGDVGSEPEKLDAEEEPKKPQSPEAALVDALNTHSPQRVFDVIAASHRALIAEVPGLFERGLSYLVHGYGESLSPTAIEALERIIQDPTWDPPPQLMRGLERGLQTAWSLRQARDTKALPEPLLELLVQSWGQDLVTVGRVWLTAAESLRELDLDGLFEELERDWPLLMGRFSLLEARMEWLVERVALEPEDLEEEYAEELEKLPSLFAIKDEGENRVLLVAVVMILMLLSWVYSAWMRSDFAGLFSLWTLGKFTGFTLFLTVFHLWRHNARRQALRVENLDTFYSFGAEFGLFPGEVAAAMVENLGEIGEENFDDAHPAYRLDRSDSALLRMMSPAHIIRLQQGMEDLHGEARAGD